MTSKQEHFVIVNDQDSGIVIFSTASKVARLCNDVEDLFIDGTFKMLFPLFLPTLYHSWREERKLCSIGIFCCQ